MRRGWRKAGIAAGLLLVFACVGAFFATTPAGAALLIDLLVRQSSVVDPETVRKQADAIVVLGGRTLRIEYAARLHLATGVPLMLVGKGTGDSGFEAESEKMEDILLRRYGVGPRWVEIESANTRENALFAWCLVESMGVRRIALVTDLDHMPRARRRFEEAGFEVLPAPAPYVRLHRPELTPANFLPSRAGIAAARLPLREWAGVVLGPVVAWLDPPRACPGAH